MGGGWRIGILSCRFHRNCTKCHWHRSSLLVLAIRHSATPRRLTLFFHFQAIHHFVVGSTSSERVSRQSKTTLRCLNRYQAEIDYRSPGYNNDTVICGGGRNVAFTIRGSGYTLVYPSW